MIAARASRSHGHKVVVDDVDCAALWLVEADGVGVGVGVDVGVGVAVTVLVCVCVGVGVGVGVGVAVTVLVWVGVGVGGSCVAVSVGVSVTVGREVAVPLGVGVVGLLVPAVGRDTLGLRDARLLAADDSGPPPDPEHATSAIGVRSVASRRGATRRLFTLPSCPTRTRSAAPDAGAVHQALPIVCRHERLVPGDLPGRIAALVLRSALPRRMWAPATTRPHGARPVAPRRRYA
jgi:hypothetical protein